MAIDSEQVRQRIAAGESLTVEFKSELRHPMRDSDIVEAVVCMANSDGGVILIGVEDNGKITGARARHGAITEPRKVQAMIFNLTVPPINTRISLHTLDEREVLAIEVDAYPEICATKDGRSVRRVDGINGPECQPFLPHEHVSRRIDLGLFDYTAQVVEGASWDDIDPLEIDRLRQTIQRLNGDRVLPGLSDRELVQALQLIETRDGRHMPNVAGLLLIGNRQALRQAVPAHEVAFQVLDERGNVPVNEWFHDPILKTLDGVQGLFRPVHREEEATVGPFRLPIPNYAPDAFREAINNAILHRDYARMGTVHVQFYPDHLSLSNPGGFLEGITQDNLLTHEPKPRNPRLAEAFRRIGLVETTGRGIDRIYLGQLRYGRPLPDYAASNREAVRLTLRGGETSLEFAVFVYEQDRAGSPLTLDDLIALDHLQYERRTDSSTVARLIQRDETYARSVLERLVERGLIEGIGGSRKRAYHLSAMLYRRFGTPSGYVRLRGFDAIQQESMIVAYVNAHGRITRREVKELCGIEDHQARHLLQRLVRERKLQRRGERRGSYYERVLDGTP